MPNHHFTFGYSRAEILGALMNAVFLLSVSLFIVLDAIGRFLEPKNIQQPLLVFFVAFGGLMINLVGIVMFCVCFNFCQSNLVKGSSSSPFCS